jgi:hypothetical protein
VVVTVNSHNTLIFAMDIHYVFCQILTELLNINLCEISDTKIIKNILLSIILRILNDTL